MIDLEKYPKFKQDSKLIKRIAFLEIEWRRAYPSVDLQSQAGWAHAWLVSGGKKYTDMSRFLNNWFKRCEQDIQKAQTSSGPIQMPKPRPLYKEPEPEGEVMSGDDFAKMKEAIKNHYATEI